MVSIGIFIFTTQPQKLVYTKYFALKMMKIFLYLVTMVTVALGSTFDAVMTIVDLDRASLKTASKNAIVATASQLMGSDVSVAFKSS